MNRKKRRGLDTEHGKNDSISSQAEYKELGNKRKYYD